MGIWNKKSTSGVRIEQGSPSGQQTTETGAALLLQFIHVQMETSSMIMTHVVSTLKVSFQCFSSLYSHSLDLNFLKHLWVVVERAVHSKIVQETPCTAKPMFLWRHIITQVSLKWKLWKCASLYQDQSLYPGDPVPGSMSRLPVCPVKNVHWCSSGLGS